MKSFSILTGGERRTPFEVSIIQFEDIPPVLAASDVDTVTFGPNEAGYCRVLDLPDMGADAADR